MGVVSSAPISHRLAALVEDGVRYRTFTERCTFGARSALGRHHALAMSVSISGFPAQRSSVSSWAASFFPIWKRIGKQGRSSDSAHVPRGLPPGYRASAIWPGSSQPHAESESAPSFPAAAGIRGCVPSPEQRPPSRTRPCLSPDLNPPPLDRNSAKTRALFFPRWSQG